MEDAALIADALERINGILHRSLEGAPPDLLCRMIARLTRQLHGVTHLAPDPRAGRHISNLAGLPELWTGNGWHARFGMETNDEETGQGHTFEQVTAFKVESAEVLLAYQDATFQQRKDYLSTVKTADLDRVLK
jgi:hypothetical protein